MNPEAPRHLNGLRQGDLGYISFEVPDLDKAVSFYGAVLGWRFRAGSGPQGRQVEGPAPDMGLWGGQERGQMIPVWRVDEATAAAARVRAAGGAAQESAPSHYGTIVSCVDDQGNRFSLWQPTPEQAAADTAYTGPRELNGARHGDVSYMTLEVQDSARVRAFYAAVLGWEFEPGRVEDGWGVNQIMPMTGMHGGHAHATAVPMYRVDDIEAAVAAVRHAGGTATDPVQQPYGAMSECVDDQGTRFYLGQH